MAALVCTGSARDSHRTRTGRSSVPVVRSEDLPSLVAAGAIFVGVPAGLARCGWQRGERLAAVWLASRPAGVRVLAALQALGWWSLLVGVVGVAVVVALRDTSPLCLD